MFRRSLQRIVREPRLRAVLAFCLFEAAFYVAYRYAMSFSQVSASPFWFPDSVMLCALLLNPSGRWWIFLLGALPIRLFSEVARDIPLWFLLTTYTIDCVRNLLTALVLRRFLKNPIRFETVQEFVLFCLWAVALIPAVFALGGAAARSMRGHDFWTAWEQWFLGNALAHLVVTPALIYWVFGAPWKLKMPSAKRGLEGVLLVVALIVTGYLAFDTGSTGFEEPRFYAPVPFLFWAAIRFGMLGASGAIAIIASLSVQAALNGRGPFSEPSPADTALALQHFLLLRAAPLYLIAILTEQRHGVERSLLESQERMSRAVKAASLWLWEWDIVSDQVWLTDPRPDKTDLGRSAPIRPDVIMQSIHPDDRDGLRKRVARAMTGNGHYEDRYRYTLRDGGLRWVLAVGQVEFDAAHNAVRMRGVSRDITDNVKTEQQLQQQRDELLQLSRVALLGELSGSLAHELNQPLTAILANAQAAQRFLRQDNPDLAEVREILGDIVADDRRAGEIIQRLRQLFRRGAIQRQPLEVNELVRDVVKLAHGELTSADVDLRAELADDLPTISGDRVELQQVLLNLITNAGHAMAGVARPGRQLTVRTGFRADEGVHVTVSDVGHGIAEDHLTQIFDPFFTTRREGMGLGLTVCRTIVNAHQGRLWAENNPGRGASFHFVLPRADASS